MAIIKGSSKSETLLGTDGPADFIYGYGGDDIILAGGGNDDIEPGMGSDFIDGGSGNNTISYLDYVVPWYVSGLVGLYVDLASGEATTFVPSYNPINANLTETDHFINIQNVAGSNSNDWIRGDGGANWLYGWDGNDERHGRGGADHPGLDDNDLLDGGEGADFLMAETVSTPRTTALRRQPSTSRSRAARVSGDFAGDTLTLIENLTGSAYNDLRDRRQQRQRSRWREGR